MDGLASMETNVAPGAVKVKRRQLLRSKLSRMAAVLPRCEMGSHVMQRWTLSMHEPQHVPQRSSALKVQDVHNESNAAGALASLLADGRFCPVCRCC
jgi:hypothetical protein